MANKEENLEENVRYSIGDVLQIGEICPEYRVIETVKDVWYEVIRHWVVMYGFNAYWDRELKHFKWSNTAQLPCDEPIKKIGHIEQGGTYVSD